MTEAAYLDWNATARVRPQAQAAVMAALEVTGNPSSVHGAGRTARRLIEDARQEVAALVGAAPREVVFTSGGTEANAMALSPVLRDRLLVSSIEHPSVLAGGRFSGVGQIPATAAGTVDLVALERLLGEHPGTLVSVMLANNETGVVQPISEVARLVHSVGGLLHVDAVQGPGRIAFDFNTLGVDLLSLSSHKIGGPQGVGALVRREALPVDPLTRGGGQERGHRAGTENVAGIAGFGAAAKVAREALTGDAAHMAALRERLEAGIRAISPEVVIFGAAAERLPNTTLFAVPGMKAETAVIAFDLEGVAVSSGSACSSGKVAPSHVLAAMGAAPELARGAVRLSLGYSTTEAEIEAFLKAWVKLTEGLYRTKNPPVKFNGIAA